MAKKLVDRYFVSTRKMLRAQMRKECKAKGIDFSTVWARYQDERRGKSKTQTFSRRMKVRVS